MKATITSIELKSSLKFFALSSNALQILRQLKASKKIAKEIRTITIEIDTRPRWAEAKELLKKGNLIKY